MKSPTEIDERYDREIGLFSFNTREPLEYKGKCYASGNNVIKQFIHSLHQEDMKEIRGMVEGLLEQFAHNEHERWAKWQKYLHSKCSPVTDGETVIVEPGSLIIPHGLVDRWERQIKTSYAELSEKEKESDRAEVRPYINTLLSKLPE